MNHGGGGEQSEPHFQCFAVGSKLHEPSAPQSASSMHSSDEVWQKYAESVEKQKVSELSLGEQ